MLALSLQMIYKSIYLNLLLYTVL